MLQNEFTIENNAIAELLGRQNFSNKESAVFELIKNSYDAGSLECVVEILPNKILITDSGIGMNLKEIEKYWMHVGKSHKKYKDPNSKRIYTGSKGVGRFALARLGNEIAIKTKKIDSEGVCWSTDWNSNSYNIDTDITNLGTTIEIRELRDKWNEAAFKNLINFLRRAYKSLEMKVIVKYDEQEKVIDSIFEENVIGVNYLSEIKLKYDASTANLYIDVSSDEFRDSVSNMVSPVSIFKYSSIYNMKEELNSINMEDLESLGDFSANLFFSMERVPKDKIAEFHYKHVITNKLNVGIVLYRNDFSITSLDGVKDWLEIGARARKSPAAAIHPTGSWRVRYNQIYGYVDIDKKQNAFLKDLANRQGLEEDEIFYLFKNIIGFGVSRFEKYRQGIIREINKENNKHKKVDVPNKHIIEFLKKPRQFFISSSETEIEFLAKEIKIVQNEKENQGKLLKENENKHNYDVRILNVLATQGLRSSSIAHDLHNKRNSLSSGLEDIRNALEEYGFWDLLSSPNYTKRKYKNVPLLLDNLSEINQKVLNFIDVILNKIEKKKFDTPIKSIEEVMSKITSNWEQQYGWVEFKVDILNIRESNLSLSEDIFDVIFDNLILNSIQQNHMKAKLTINIKIVIKDDEISVYFSDNGIGLDEKYSSDPMRILDVHETSRKEGHGLGMWIINTTLNVHDGEVTNIFNENGFNIEFRLKGTKK